MKYRFNILFILSITMISALGTGSSNLVSMFVLYRILERADGLEMDVLGRNLFLISLCDPGIFYP